LHEKCESIVLPAQVMIAIRQFNILHAGETSIFQGIDHGAGLLDGNSPIFRPVNDQERGAYLVGMIDRRRVCVHLNGPSKPYVTSATTTPMMSRSSFTQSNHRIENFLLSLSNSLRRAFPSWVVVTK